MSIKNLFRCLLLIVTVRFISFPLSFIVSVVSVEDFQFFQACFIRYTCFSSFRQIVSVKNLLKMLVTSCYSLFQQFSIHFHCFSCFSGRCPIFLEGRCLLLIVTVRFIGFLLIYIVSVVSVEDVQFFPLLSLSCNSNRVV